MKTVMEEQNRGVKDLEKYLVSLREKKGLLIEQIKDVAMELERNEKKLRSLTSVKPVYVEEMEIQQEILSKLFMVYAEKVQNLDYLEEQFDKVNYFEMGG